MNVNIIFKGREFPICQVVANRFHLVEGQEITSQRLFHKIIDQHNAHLILLLKATTRFAN